MDRIKALAENYYDEYKRIREHLHRNPEVSGQEYETCKYVQQELDKLGIPNKVMYKTGVVALIVGAKPGKTVLLRGDMDALPINEETDVPFKSETPGVMHACGHDGHTAGLLGAAMILNDLKDELHGTVKLMFQPDEEFNGGARQMIEEGLLENPKVDAAFGIHLWGPLPFGTVWYKDGPMMAAPDAFEITIKGKGTHSAMPHLGIDPVVIAANTVSEFQNIVARRIDPLRPAVLSTCSIHGGDAFNVIPQEVTLKGSVRTLHSDIQQEIKDSMERILKAQAIATGCTYDFKYTYRYPAVVNHESTNRLAAKSFAKIIGDDNVRELPEPNMGGEDFSYLGQHVPASYLFVGIKEEGKDEPVHHHPAFQWSTKILKTTAAGLAQTAFDYLNNNKGY
ncbi:MAG: amidohydrolase [Turicibacter sp.]|nr:amidohydrolase [Turicibacter sp.]